MKNSSVFVAVLFFLVGRDEGSESSAGLIENMLGTSESRQPPVAPAGSFPFSSIQ